MSKLPFIRIFGGVTMGKNLNMRLRVENNRFEASHKLINYCGDCANLHGHSYRLDVDFSGEVQPDKGMVCDFKLLKKAIKATTSQFDHKYVNDVMDENPTAENMAIKILHDLRCELDDLGLSYIEIARIQLWETEHCCAIIEVE